MRLPATGFVVSCLAAAMVAAQSAQQPLPTFKSGIDVVAVDVSALDGKGRPVKDLTAGDFTVTVDGSPRRLVSATFIPLGTEPHSSPVAAEPSAPPYSTNEGAVGGRLVLVVVDRGSIRPGDGRWLFEKTGDFIDRLGPADRVALAVIPGGRYVEFTADRDRVKTALQKVVGGATPLATNFEISLTEALAIHRQNVRVRESVIQRNCYLNTNGATGWMCRMGVLDEARLIYLTWRQQASASLAALRNLLARLELVGGPKTMVLLSGRVYVDPAERTELAPIQDAAARADVTLYALGLDSPRNDASTALVSPTYRDDRVLLQTGLELLAGQAGGHAFSVAAGSGIAFERLRRELSGYYLLSFEATAADGDGRPHRVDVHVRRPGVDIRSRRHFLGLRGSAPRPVRDVLAELLRAPRLATALRMRVVTFTFPGDEGQLRVVITAAIAGSMAAGPIPCGFSLANAAGKVVGAEVEGTSAAERHGDHHEYLASFVLDPGSYTLKLATVDSEGRRGSVEHAFDARVSVAGPLRVGDLVLADDGDGPGAAPRFSIDGRVGGDTLIGYVEFASDAPSALDAARVELEVAASDSGPAIARADARIQPRSASQRTAEGRLSTARLAPGAYVARARLSVGGRQVTQVTRAFQLERTPAPPPSSPRTTEGAAAHRAAAPR